MDTSIQRDLMGYGFMALAGYLVYKKLFGPGEERIPEDSPIAVGGLTGGLLQTSYNLGTETGEALGDLINAAVGAIPSLPDPPSIPEISPLPSIPEAVQDSPLADFVSQTPEDFYNAPLNEWLSPGSPQILPSDPIEAIPIEEPTASISLPVYGAVSGVPTQAAPIIPDPVVTPVGGEAVWVSGVGWANPGTDYYPGG